jgi:ribosome-associated protein
VSRKTSSEAPLEAAQTPRPARKSEEKARETALQIAAAALEKKALHVEILDVRGKVDYTDFVVIMSGRSDRQVNAIASGVRDIMKLEHDEICNGLEGLPQGHWVLMDYGDVVVHVFHQDTRGYYDLEALWIDATRVEFDDTAVSTDSTVED